LRKRVILCAQTVRHIHRPLFSAGFLGSVVLPTFTSKTPQTQKPVGSQFAWCPSIMPTPCSSIAGAFIHTICNQIDGTATYRGQCKTSFYLEKQAWLVVAGPPPPCLVPLQGRIGVTAPRCSASRSGGRCCWLWKHWTSCGQPGVISCYVGSGICHQVGIATAVCLKAKS